MELPNLNGRLHATNKSPLLIWIAFGLWNPNGPFLAWILSIKPGWRILGQKKRVIR